MLHENLQYALDSYGPVRKIRDADQSELARLRTILPSPLADFIEQKGYCSFHDGLFTMCNPDDMRPILALVFRADEQFHHNDCHVIGYTAFGDLHVWSDKFYNFDIILAEGFIYSNMLTNIDIKPSASIEQIASGSIPNAEFSDFVDYENEPMFARCQALYGSLEPGQCYGFFPALTLVGLSSQKRSVENIRRVKAMEHFTILSQMTTFHLMKITPDGVAPVRPVG